MPNHFKKLTKLIPNKFKKTPNFQNNNSSLVNKSSSADFLQSHLTSSSNLITHYIEPQDLISPEQDLISLEDDHDNRLTTTQRLSNTTKKQSKFKTLYPTEIEDLTRKEKFRLINEIGGFKQPHLQKDTYVKAWQEGENAYLFTGRQPAEQVVIDCHGSHRGGQDEIMQPIQLTKDTPRLFFCLPIKRA